MLLLLMACGAESCSSESFDPAPRSTKSAVEAEANPRSQRTGWIARTEQGAAYPEEIQTIETRLSPCPASEDTWMARYEGGALVSLGPLASGRTPTEVNRVCLEAGLRVVPLSTDTLLRVSWSDPQLDTWRALVGDRLDQIAGPSTAPSCANLRFSLASDGALEAPKLVGGSGDEAFDASLLAALGSLDQPLPPVPNSALDRASATVDFCVAGL